MLTRRGALAKIRWLRICWNSVAEVAAVVLVDPAHDGDREHGGTDDRNPESRRDAEEDQPQRTGQGDRPPAPRAEVTLLGLPVVDVRVVPVRRQLGALRLVHPPQVEG